jgi:hypothetical protein
LAEYETVVTDLLGARPAVLAWSAPDVLVHGFDTNADALSITSGNFDDFATAAEMIANGVDVSSLAPCAAGDAPESCARRFASSFAERAYGRPLTDAEPDRLAAIYQAGEAVGGYERGIRLLVETVLSSPYFLYRTELGDDHPAFPNSTSLTAYETATALSFALTGSRPDAELLWRVKNDPQFLSSSVLHEETARLLDTDRAREHTARFLRGWLGILDVRSVNKIPGVFPEFTLELKADLDREVTGFLDWVMRDGGGTLEALIGAPVTYANRAILGIIYDFDYASVDLLPYTPDDGSFTLIPFNPAYRRGILSLGGWLAAHSPVHRSSPVDRGLAIRNRFFCQNLSPPPPGVLFTAPEGGDGVSTTRQQFEQHESDALCQSCHHLMDPIGFGFEMMDGIGRHRDTEVDLPVDSSGVLAGTDVDGPFQGPAELADMLLQSKEVRDCFVLQVFRYVEGRDETGADTCTIAPLQDGFAAGNRPMSEPVLRMVLGDSFVRRSFEP